MESDDELKRCCKCGEILPLMFFPKTDWNSDGLISQCSYCKGIVNKRYYDKVRIYKEGRFKNMVTGTELKEILIKFREEDGPVNEYKAKNMIKGDWEHKNRVIEYLTNTMDSRTGSYT